MFPLALAVRKPRRAGARATAGDRVRSRPIVAGHVCFMPAIRGKVGVVVASRRRIRSRRARAACGDDEPTTTSLQHRRASATRRTRHSCIGVFQGYSGAPAWAITAGAPR